MLPRDTMVTATTLKAKKLVFTLQVCVLAIPENFNNIALTYLKQYVVFMYMKGSYPTKSLTLEIFITVFITVFFSNFTTTTKLKYFTNLQVASVQDLSGTT